MSSATFIIGHHIVIVSVSVNIINHEWKANSSALSTFIFLSSGALKELNKHLLNVPMRKLC